MDNMQITKTLNKAEATELFEKEAILIGHDNAIPFYRAVELFGEWAAEFIDRCMEEHSYLDFGRDYSGWGLSEGRPYTEYFYKPGFMKLGCEYNDLQIVKVYEESESGQLIDKYTAECSRRRDVREVEEERKKAEHKAKRAAARAAKKGQEGQ